MPKKAMTLTDAQKKEVETLAAVLTRSQIANYFGICEKTFYSIVQRDELVATSYKKGKAKAINIVAGVLMKKILEENDLTASIFYLKTQGGWKSQVEAPHFAPDKFDNFKDESKLKEIASESLDAMLKGEITLDQHSSLLDTVDKHLNVIHGREIRELTDGIEQKLEEAKMSSKD